MDRVVADRRPVVVTRQKAEAVVMVALADWNAMEAATYFLLSRRSFGRLAEGLAELDAGAGTEHDPIVT